ncbi:RNA polymerase sigma factor [Lederbergia wuyishanensis]|uniref:RNA polymerase sigma-70 factor (ECF subfamily) n=1 Tax=Lederbergia wuyishanensis TaxID=1347903 RepID=A0ABU0D8B2_9BACI|nr:RNA polymerase sigma factor [Lederbergia wuyishanensis]MCJ8009222.1 RNA polymerase sigma factor [Lederbergia wuyishanensis]MDQ0344648.1 RNA polymerase sigma-70 factor (ECF subfamily) [Lederbergia wuyishanensis]
MEASDLYEKLKTDLHRFALSISRHEHEANDLVQDALMKSLKETELFSLPEYKQKAWFYRVMKNKLIDERRKENRLSEWDEDFDIPAQVFTGNHIEMAELLSHLPAELSDIVFKRYWLGLNSKEMGKQLGLPPSTIRYKLHMAIKRLRSIMEMEEGK